MRRSSINELLPPWSSRIRPYPPGKPLEEVERELGRSAIKLASNENPLGPSPKALEAIGRALHKVHLYPDGQGYYLRRRLAECHGLDMNQIVLGAGSTDLIELVGKTFTTEPYGVGVKKGDTQFRNFINDTLEAAKADGRWMQAWQATAGKVATEQPSPPAVDRY